MELGISVCLSIIMVRAFSTLLTGPILDCRDVRVYDVRDMMIRLIRHSQDHGSSDMIWVASGSR